VSARLLAAAAVGAVLVLLWFMPGVVFPHPGANDALELAYLGPLLYLFILGASIVSVVGVVSSKCPRERRYHRDCVTYGLVAKSASAKHDGLKQQIVVHHKEAVARICAN
jgi:hypothetical protein